jgi:small conductance mechanosensitive channel
VNYTHLGSALVEIPADLAGNTNIEDLRQLILPIIAQDTRIYTDPPPSIGIVALKPGSVTVAFRAFTLPQNQPAVTGRMIETIKAELEKNNIADPIPHSFVHTIDAANH